jgi:uncharacterized phage-associated protein
MKMLYFSDYFFYQKHLKTITGAKYVALQRGPAIDGYEEAFKEMEEAKFIKVLLVPVMGHNTLKQEFQRIGEPDPIAFSPEERSVMDEVIARFGARRTTGRELTDMTHLELTPWKAVWNPKATGAPIPFGMFRWLENLADASDEEMARKRAKARSKTKAKAA